MIRVLASIAVALTLGASDTATAHGGLGAGTLQVSVVGTIAHVNVTPPPELFTEFDTNGDGVLAEDEVAAQRAEMLEFFLSGLSIRNPDGVDGEYVLQDLALPVHVHEGEQPYVRVTLRLQWVDAPETLSVEYAFGEQAPLRVAALRSTGDAPLRTTGELGPDYSAIALFER